MNGIGKYAVFCALCFICPMGMFVLGVYAFTFLICAPLYGLLLLLKAIGFHYMWIHFGLFGALGYGVFLGLILWVLGYLILDWLQNI